MVISNSDITIDAGLKERRLFQLKKTIERKELVGLIVLQIRDLVEFLGLVNKMSAKQIFDTAEIILDDYSNFSLMALQDCFNRIKRSEPPFDEELYNSISGRKILKWLQKYGNLQEDYLLGQAESKVNQEIRQAEIAPKTKGNLYSLSDAFAQLKQRTKKLKNKG